MKFFLSAPRNSSLMRNPETITMKIFSNLEIMKENKNMNFSIILLSKEVPV
jgi:hypothetical protein